MCGIIGIISSGDSVKYEPAARAMMSAISHRGPDGEGLTQNFRKCILGHRRLSIVDLATGAQPMFSDDKNLAVVFNGEIYGYKKIRDELSTYHFRTNSDTEIILALYEKFGERLTKALPGMFAWALWDEKNETLVAARDRFGEKPFYYAIGRNGEFIFASEIKAILASGLVDTKINRDSLAHYLKKLYVHPRDTIYEQIHTLPPAHCLTYKSGKIEVSRYWHLPKINQDIRLAEAIPEFKRLLEEAVKRQLVADVPVGAFLSGGLDSTTIVHLASRINPRIKTFSFGFEGYKNELPFAKAAAEEFGTEHQEIYEREYDIASLILKMADIYDEPFADSSNIPTFLISKRVREHAKVVLSGDGGDELLAGYGWYKTLLDFGEKAKKPTKQLFMRVVAQIAMRQNWRNKVGVINNARSLYYNTKFSSIIDAHRASNVYFKDCEIANLGIVGQPHKKEPSFALANQIDDAMRDDIEDYMPGDILTKTDRASMANSLELRAPFLDTQFAEFAVSLPYSLKINSNEDKIILRRAYEAAWPAQIRNRAKQGFGAPIHWWLRKPEVKILVDEFLNNPQKKIYGYLSFKNSKKYIARLDYKTWILLTLSIWMEKH